MIKPIKGVIIFKVYKKKISGIIMATDKGKDTTQKWQIEKSEVYAVGDEIKSVKPGDIVDLINRPFYGVDVDKYLGGKKDENIDYVRGKEEDINFIIE